MATPDDKLNIKINHLTFAIFSAGMRRKKTDHGIIIHLEILYIIMSSSIMSTMSWLMQFSRKYLRESLFS